MNLPDIIGWRGVFGPNTRRILGYLRPERKRIWAIAGLALLYVPVSLFEPYLLIYLFDRILMAQRPDLLLGLALRVAPFFALATATEFLLAYTMLGMSRDLHKEIKAIQLRNLLQKSSNFFRNTASGRLLFSFFNDSNQIGSLLSLGLVNALLHVFLMLTRIGILWYLDLELLFAYAFVIPVQLLVLYRVMKVAMRLEITLKRRDEDLTSRIEQLLRGSLVVKAFGFGMPLASIWNRVFGTRLDIDFKNAMYKQAGALVIASLQLLGAFVVLFIGVYKISEGDLTVGSLLAFSAVSARVTPSIQALVGFMVGLQEAMVNVERYYRVYDLPDESREFQASVVTGGERRTEELRDAQLREIALHDVRVDHGGGPALRIPCDISLTMGETCLWHGPNGAGKTSLAMALAGLIPHSPGSIRCGGAPLTDFSLESIREKILYVGGDPFWPDRTLRANFANDDAAELDSYRLSEALRVSTADAVLDSLPKGMETVLLSDGHILSRGENQRLFLAMALYRDPSVMILDEALANVSGDLVVKILRQLSSSRKDKLVIHIAQRPELYGLCDRQVAFGRPG